MSKEEENDIIKKLAEGELNRLEANTNEEVKQSKRVLDSAGSWTTLESKSKDEVWANLQKKLNLTEEIKEKSGKIYYVRASIAAMLILGLTFTYYFLFNKTVEIQTLPNQVTTLFLPDSSKIVLNAASVIIYNKEDYLQERKIKLQGEAYFEVKKGTPFTVETNGVTTLVVGTSFNIYARTNTTVVKCITGKVKVTDNSSQTILDRGEMIEGSFNKLDKSKTTFDLENATGWIDGNFKFENIALNTVVKELEIQFSIEIEGADFSNKKYTGNFNKKSLTKALNQVLKPMGYNYVIIGNKVHIE